MGNKNIRAAVIMAGGSGERFWPLSRHQRPKQLLKLTDQGRTLLEDSIDRIKPLIPPEFIFIATAEHLLAPIRRAQTGVPEENVLGEPFKRNTSGCLAFTVSHLLSRWPGKEAELTMAVLTADHLIGKSERFRSTIQRALETVERYEVLATVGITPTRPETGYGYIEVAVKEKEEPGQGTPPRVFPVVQFREKPDASTAGEFVSSGNFFWNSGMFIWKVSTFLNELSRVQPGIYQAVQDMILALNHGEEEKVRSIFKALDNISIDYALMERAKNVVMIPADFPWEDLGSWDSLERTFPLDENGNVAVGDPVLVDAKNCVVYNEPGAANMALSVVGVENLVVVTTSDGVLVVAKDKVQDVRSAVQKLKERKAGQV